MAFGVFPDELDVLHRCDNPSCVNPAHLFLGTQRDNALDAIQKGKWNMETVKDFLSRAGKRGGRARAKKLSPKRRSAIARKAARALWAKRRKEAASPVPASA
jgi:hypothetical protein